MDTTPRPPRFELPGLWLNESELFGLLATERLLDQMQPGLLSPYIGPLRGRIRRLLAASGHSAARVSERILFLSYGSRRGNPERFGIIAAAVLEGHQLQITYHGRQSDLTRERLVHPQRLARYKDNWFLLAHCEQAGKLRTFSLDRIRHAVALSKPAQVIDAKSLDRETGASFGIFSGPAIAWAVLRFSPNAARWVADETWHPDQLAQWVAGDYELQVPYSDPRELIMDILRYGPDVEVLAPNELREAVAERLRAAAALYPK